MRAEIDPTDDPNIKEIPRILPVVGVDLLAKWERFVSSQFPVLEGGSFLDDFPVWTPDLGAEVRHVAVIDSSGEMLSTAAVRVTRLRIGATQVPVGVVGAVATRPDCRGKGLATRCVQAVEGWALKHEVAAFFLWGSEHGLYRRMGYELCGRQVLLPAAAVRRSGRSIRGVEFHYGWHPSIFQMMRKREGGLFLRAADEKWIAAHKNVVWLRAEAQGKMLAYLAFGRGADLGNMIHEFGGDPTTVPLLIERIRQAVPDATVLCSPETALNLAEPSNIPHSECLAMIKTVDPSVLVRAALPTSAVVAEFEGEKCRMTINGIDLGAQDSVSLSRLLFGPHSADSPFTSAAQAAGLPLNVWIWGLDAS